MDTGGPLPLIYEKLFILFTSKSGLLEQPLLVALLVVVVDLVIVVVVVLLLTKKSHTNRSHVLNIFHMHIDIFHIYLLQETYLSSTKEHHGINKG